MNAFGPRTQKGYFKQGVAAHSSGLLLMHVGFDFLVFLFFLGRRGGGGGEASSVRSLRVV